MAKVGRGAEQFMLRLPDGMRDRIKEAADANGRSMNAEIIAALEEMFPTNFPLDMVESTLLSLKIHSHMEKPDRAKIIDTVNQLDEDVAELKKHLLRGGRD